MTWDKLLARLDEFSVSGWRRVFFWMSVTTVAVALPTVYIFQPMVGVYAPVDFLDRLNTTLTIVAGLAGLRGVEKYAERTQAVEAASG